MRAAQDEVARNYAKRAGSQNLHVYISTRALVLRIEGRVLVVYRNSKCN